MTRRSIFLARLEHRLQAVTDLLLAIGLGFGLALVLVAWWSS